MKLNLKPWHHWSLAEAALLVAHIQQEAFDAGFNISIGGGVINNGYSSKDLDLVATARGREAQHADIHGILTSVEFASRYTREQYPGARAKFQDSQGKTIEVLIVGGTPLPTS